MAEIVSCKKSVSFLEPQREKEQARVGMSQENLLIHKMSQVVEIDLTKEFSNLEQLIQNMNQVKS